MKVGAEDTGAWIRKGPALAQAVGLWDQEQEQEQEQEQQQHLLSPNCQGGWVIEVGG